MTISTGPCDPPYGDFIAGRGVQVNGQALRQRDDGDEAGVDLTSRWSVRFRATLDPAPATPAFVIDEQISASVDNAASGYYDEYVPLGDTAYDALTWEEVLVDSSTNDSTTSTKKAEQVLRWWRQPILARTTLP